MGIKNGGEDVPKKYILHKFCIKENVINSLIKFDKQKKLL